MSARTSHHPALRAQRGFSLVELMVGMLLSLVLLAVSVAILVGLRDKWIGGAT